MHVRKLKSRRDFIRLAAAATAAPFSAIRTVTALGQESTGDWAGYDQAIVIDALASPIQFNIPQESLPLRPESLDHVRTSGITAVNVTVSSPATEAASAFENTLNQMDAWSTEVATNPDVFVVVERIEDILEAKRFNRLGLIFGFQHADPFEDEIDRLEDFYALGLRIVQLTYNGQNRLGAGCLVPQDEGLTSSGHEAVARMDDLGILVDVSHCGARTTLDGILASSRPVAITHSGCNSVFRHPRNKDDETLRILADRGGVFGIYLMPFLNPEGPPNANHVLDHIEHALNVCGEDHVGIGSDQGVVPLDVSGDFPQRFEAVSAQRAALGVAAPREDTIPFVPELNHPRRIEIIADLMAERGHTERVIEKVVGTNFVRLFDQVWS
jgi:membrane dipeptidase